MKRIVSLLTILAMLVCMVPTTFALEASEDGSYIITELGDYTAVVNQENYWNVNYSFTATKSGALTITIDTDSCADWCFGIQNSNREEYGYGYASAAAYGESYDEVATVEVAVGDIVTINVYNDGTDGEIAFNLSLDEYEVEPFVSLSASTYYLPADTVTIPAGGQVLYRVSNSLNGGKLTLTGATAYVVIGEETYLPDDSGVITLSLGSGKTDLYVGNSGTEDAVYTWNYDFPIGHSKNPLVVDSNVSYSVAVESAGYANAYYLKYTVEEDSMVTVNVSSSDNYFVYFYSDNYDYSEYLYGYKVGSEASASLPLYAGDVITIYVNFCNDSYTYETGSADITVTYEKIDLYEGSVYEPVYLSSYYCPTQTLEIGAGKTLYYELTAFSGYTCTVTGEGAYVIMDDVTYEAVDGVVSVPISDSPTIVQIGNAGTEAAIFDVGVVYPVGAENNPEKLVDGHHDATVAKWGTYYYTFTATEDCTLTLTPDADCTDWEIGCYGYASGYVSSNYGDTELVVEVAADCTVTIYICTASYEAGTVSFTSVTESGFASSELPEADIEDGGALILGNNNVELASGDQDGSSWTYTAESDGTLTITVTGLQMYYDYGDGDAGWADGSEYIERQFSMGSYHLSVDGTDNWTYTYTVEVTAGQEVSVQMYSAMAAWSKAVLTLSFEGNIHDASDGTLLLGDNTVELPYGSLEGGTWVYTATEAGTLVLNLTSGSVFDDWFEQWGDITEADLTSAFLNGSMMLTINGEPYYSMPVSLDVEVGDEITVTMAHSWGYWMVLNLNLSMQLQAGTGTSDDPYVIDELPHDIVFSSDDPDEAYIGAWYVYEAEEDGTILVTPSEGTFLGVMDSNYNECDYTDGIAVSAGDKIYFIVASDEGVAGEYVVNLDFLVDITLDLGDNTIDYDLEYTYTAEADGTLYLSVLELYYGGPAWSEGDLSFLGSWASVYVDGVELSELCYGTIEVTAGQTVTVVLESNDGDTYYAVLNLSYDGYAYEPGSAMNPDTLLIGENSASVPGGFDGYYYEWTASVDGTLSLSVSGDNWYFEAYLYDANGEYVGFYEGAEMYETELPVTIEVKAGYTLELNLMGIDADWNFVGGDMTVVASFAPDALLGDINGDGSIDILDANLAAAYYNERVELTDLQVALADVDGDGDVDILDANLIAAFYNERIDKFPVEE